MDHHILFYLGFFLKKGFGSQNRPGGNRHITLFTCLFLLLIKVTSHWLCMVEKVCPVSQSSRCFAPSDNNRPSLCNRPEWWP